MLGSVIFILAFIAGLLLASFFFIKGIRRRKEFLDRLAITLGSLIILALSIPIGFVGITGIQCDIYTNDLENQIEKLDRSCQNESDCMLIMYYGCKPYCVNSSVNLSLFTLTSGEPFLDSVGCTVVLLLKEITNAPV